MVKFSKLCSQSFTTSLIDVVFSNVVKFSDGKSVKSCIIRMNKKISAASQTVATALNRAKNLTGPPSTFGSHCSRFHPNRFTFGRVIAECTKTVLLLLQRYRAMCHVS